MDSIWVNYRVMTRMLLTLMGAQRHVTLRQDSNVEEAHLPQEIGVQRFGTMDLIMVSMNAIRATIIMQMDAINLDELSQGGFVTMEDIGLQTCVGIGAGTEDDCQLKNATIITLTN